MGKTVVKRIPIHTLMSHDVVGIFISTAVDSGLLHLDKAISPKTFHTLVMLARTGHDWHSMSYGDIQVLAKKNDISENLSKTTIKACLDILNNASRESSSISRRCDLLEYAIKTRITPLLMAKEIDRQKVERKVWELIAPICSALSHFDKDPREAVKVVPILNKTGSIAQKAAELLLVLIEQPDNNFSRKEMQRIALKKTEGMLSYKQIQDVIDSRDGLVNEHSGFSSLAEPFFESVFFFHDGNPCSNRLFDVVSEVTKDNVKRHDIVTDILCCNARCLLLEAYKAKFK
jgi:hypothetical protein